jgi:hypothetical protein
MTTYRRVRNAQPSIISYEFNYYNEAVQFACANELLEPSKPYKRGAVWVVSMRNPAPKVGLYAKVDDWKKPFSTYDEWRGVEGLERIPVHLTEAQVGKRVREVQQERLEQVKWTGLPQFVYDQAHNSKRTGFH